MSKQKPKKGRYNFLIPEEIYADFSLLCEELGFVRSKKIELLMKDFIEKHKEELKQIQDEE